MRPASPPSRRSLRRADRRRQSVRRHRCGGFSIPSSPTLTATATSTCRRSKLRHPSLLREHRNGDRAGLHPASPAPPTRSTASMWASGARRASPISTATAISMPSSGKSTATLIISRTPGRCRRRFSSGRPAPPIPSTPSTPATSASPPSATSMATATRISRSARMAAASLFLEHRHVDRADLRRADRRGRSVQRCRCGDRLHAGLADLDGDRDLDPVVGEDDGTCTISGTPDRTLRRPSSNGPGPPTRSTASMWGASRSRLPTRRRRRPRRHRRGTRRHAELFPATLARPSLPAFTAARPAPPIRSTRRRLSAVTISAPQPVADLARRRRSRRRRRRQRRHPALSREHRAPAHRADAFTAQHRRRQSVRRRRCGDLSADAAASPSLDGDGDSRRRRRRHHGRHPALFRRTPARHTAPAFTERTGAANPFDGLVIGARQRRRASPHLDGARRPRPRRRAPHTTAPCAIIRQHRRGLRRTRLGHRQRRRQQRHPGGECAERRHRQGHRRSGDAVGLGRGRRQPRLRGAERSRARHAVGQRCEPHLYARPPVTSERIPSATWPTTAR